MFRSIVMKLWVLIGPSVHMLQQKRMKLTLDATRKPHFKSKVIKLLTLTAPAASF